MVDITITYTGFAELLINLNPSKAAGPDELKPRLLKDLTNEIVLI